MKLIIGLGNPGVDYKGTRHNIGFQAINALADNYGIKTNRNRFKALFGEARVKDKKIVLAKPQTYMNLSGESVKMLVSWYKVTPKDIIIIYDDASLSPGEIRMKRKGGAGGHNGVKSIIQHLGTDEFKRIKVGIGEKPKGWNLADYVLSRFSNIEMEIIDKTMEDIVDAVDIIVDQGIDVAMNKYNAKTRG